MKATSYKSCSGASSEATSRLAQARTEARASENVFTSGALPAAAAAATAAGATSASVLRIQNLSFSYGDQKVLSSCNLEIKPSEFVALVGDNGAGKSTLMKLILHMLIPSSGHIFLFGDDVVHNSHYPDIAYVSQNSVLGYKHFPTTVEELISIHVSYLHTQTDVESLLALVKLEAHRHKRLNELSGGQLQRVGILLALIKNASLILLDEPTTGVDKKFSHDLYHLLKQLSQQGKTILLITHHLQELKSFCDCVVRLEEGKLHEQQLDSELHHENLRNDCLMDGEAAGAGISEATTESTREGMRDARV